MSIATHTHHIGDEVASAASKSRSPHHIEPTTAPAPTSAPALGGSSTRGTFDDIRIERLGPAFGAIIHGVNLRSVPASGTNRLRKLLNDHKVLFFPGQDLTDAEQVALGAALGSPTEGHPVSPANNGNASIYDLDSTDPNFSFSDQWHTDVTFMERPPAISILRAVELPPFSGDTSWADSEAAYTSLSPLVQQLVDRLEAVHDGNREWGAYLRRLGKGTWEGKEFTTIPPVTHPVVRVHPETGRKGLFVNPGFVSHIANVSEEESRGLLDLLYAHLTRPEHTIRHRWSLGDVGIWDNRCTAHYANRDYSDRRVMRRVTIAGGPVDGPSAR